MENSICDWASENGPNWHKLHITIKTLISCIVYSCSVSCKMLLSKLCIDDATNLKKMVKIYVPTWTLFTGPVTYFSCLACSSVGKW